MASQDSQNGADFFKDLSHYLKSENVTFSPPNENSLTVLLNGWPVGRVSADGSMHFKVGYLDTAEARELYLRVEGIASEVHGHMEQMV